MGKIKDMKRIGALAISKDVGFNLIERQTS